MSLRFSGGAQNRFCFALSVYLADHFGYWCVSLHMPQFQFRQVITLPRFRSVQGLPYDYIFIPACGSVAVGVGAGLSVVGLAGAAAFLGVGPESDGSAAGAGSVLLVDSA